ncbi:N-acetylmuramoyl-L-alanine amidase [Streptomyces sp. ISL-36]|uniref:N-acetylmuramoyl-L-alanine amidase n=1 Tax=Streptomyces sp. ISL-36 TaxID=2819182 RepID=UPI001BE85FFA|nr:N-acetylmuramoyl-L-alanine amidase [Streptomyces sp. ISL-36]MBT2443603.1 N-acetylmuramoyl-L-alanine amidase [Streptomyces sp. ISL-36]
MRAYLASSIAVTCAAALALPLSVATPAASLPSAALPPPGSVDPAGSPRSSDSRGSADSAGSVDSTHSTRSSDSLGPSLSSGSVEPDVAGSTQSLPLGPLGTADRAVGRTAVQGLTRRDVRPFSLLGVVWDDARAHLHGTVQVRTRAAGGTRWSPWQDVEIHSEEHGADPGTPEATAAALRGATAPLWVGDSDGVEIRVRPKGEREAVPLPAGMRLELVDPGPEPAAAGMPSGTEGSARSEARTPAVEQAAATSVSTRPGTPSGTGVLPALSREATEATLGAAAAKPFIGPRPKIITRKGWGADEKMREKSFVYTKAVKAAFVHHSATGNNYTCRQAPSVLRSIYRYHVKSSGWRDFGYNFAIDKCGNIYEGRAGGVAKPVLGAHTLGFNTNSMGIAVLGTYSSTTPPAAVVTAVAKLTAWKLGLHGVNPKGKVTLTSGGGNRYKKGKKVKFNAIAGHRDGFATACPGARLYGKLGTARTASAKYQGRR